MPQLDTLKKGDKMLDGNTAALNKHLDEVAKSEQEYEEILQLIEARLDDTIEEIHALVKEIDYHEYNIDARTMIIEHLESLI